MTDEKTNTEQTPVEEPGATPVTEAAAAKAAAEDATEQPTAEVEVEPRADAEPADEAAEPVAEAEPAEAVEEAAADVAEPVAEADAAKGADETTEELAAEPEGSAEASEPEAAEEAAAAVVSQPKKKRKRLPRSERRQRTKARPEKPATRKSITRLPKPEHERGRRHERQGTVVSAASDKTIVVRVEIAKLHPMYKKVIKRSTKLHAHDEANEAKVGDVVRIVETRPLSKMKRWRLQEIVEAAK